MRAALPPLVGAFLVIIAVAAAPQAAAHATRIATDPAVNATLISGPPRVSATFNEHLQDTFAAMTVVGPDGNLWSTGQPHVDGAIVSVDVLPLGPVGTYTVNYRVTSADGHVVSGSWSFQLTVAGTGQPGPPAEQGSAKRIPIWPLIAVAAALAASLLLYAARGRRHYRDS